MWKWIKRLIVFFVDVYFTAGSSPILLQSLMLTVAFCSYRQKLIRPLYLIREDDIKAWRDYNNLYFIQCACKFTDTCTTCNNEESKSKRIEVKELIKRLKKINPYVESNIFRSVENVNLDTIIASERNTVFKL